ncbi:MAG: MBOAT family protein [Alistipes sp.]|nr:MBOAT family protein [Alistipes sp.]
MELPVFADDIVGRIEALLLFDESSPMTLASGFFMLAFILFLTGYAVVRRVVTLRTLYVAAFSLYFYYKLSGIYLLLLLFVALNDFFIAGRVAHDRRYCRSGRRWVVWSVTVNVAILAYFKATGFFVDLLEGLYGEGVIDMGKVIAPAGVSFFVFQSISYVVDIYRDRIRPLGRFADYLFLLSFFPKMFLGPLVRNADFISQMHSRDIAPSREDVERAARLIAGGLVKYAVLAKCIGVLLVRPAFAGQLGDGGFVALMAVYGFTMQIYCDFSGYSDLAVGVALMMGFRLPQNFDAPYHSATITEFWRRWHISLSTWLKDYLYISLGGNRRGRLRTYWNLIVTMFLGGLWHGVGLTFIAWGLLHGVALALHKVWLAVIPGAAAVGWKMPWWRRVPGVIITFHLVAFGWLLFNASDMTEVAAMLGNMVGNFDTAQIVPFVESHWVAFVMMGVGYAMHALPTSFDRRVESAVIRGGFVVQVVLIVAAIWCTMQCSAMLEAADVAGAGLPIYANF